MEWLLWIFIDVWILYRFMDIIMNIIMNGLIIFMVNIMYFMDIISFYYFFIINLFD